MIPDYGVRSLAEVLPGLLDGAFGLEPARAVALLLVDGLGAELLAAHAEFAPFLSSLSDAGPLTVGFPSSTAISLASIGTGLPPGGHGLLGTSLRLSDEVVMDTLRWTEHGTQGKVDLRESWVPETVQPAGTVFERAEAAGIAVHVVSQPAFEHSGLTRAVLRGGAFVGTHALGDLAGGMLAALSEPGRQLVYGYHADLDAMGHVYGPGSVPWQLQLAQVDRLVESLAALLPEDTLLAVTGDHGMVTMTDTVDADTHPDLRTGVAALSGEPRARHVHAEPGAAADVLSAWQEVLGDAAWTVSREQAVQEGWFGPVSSRYTDRIGDVVAAARGGFGVTRTKGEAFLSSLVGQHGSLTSAEQLVPLLVARSTSV
ncbi:alkaline phosphatase family protein [Actinophytocola oryzae]|uniref:Type I phosphodiesterase/nucleotide pyrophosphatase n=1 Tax=Actinophytocola oryzae TaxID=502181 RepID=A0A4R7VZ47_9PSEU|nr:nucleotide pyrophosphatase/phosphodiesterase family protein [Actinophytocola oryzae]TDV55055.1 type I phosphodiesterase/nucleotide pyrophosphatase [Actinophytocola oryzae]